MSRFWRYGLALMAVVLLVAALRPSGEDPVWSLLSAGPLADRQRDQAAVAGEGGTATFATAEAGADAGADPADEPANAMQLQLRDIARAYAENARYPAYAIPLNGNDWNLLNPRAFVARKAALANVPGMSATLVVSHYIVDRGVDLPVQVLFAAEPGTAVAATGVRVLLRQNGQGSAPVALAAVARPDADQVFAGVLPASLLRAVAVGEAALVAEVQFNSGERSALSAMIKLYEPEARLLRLGSARIEGANLVIPAYFGLTGSGYFRVEANLFQADTGEPVSHLSAELPLSADQATGLLKVHAVTLRAKGAAGPYVLRDIDITRLSAHPGEPSGHGSSAAETFAVRGFPLDSYSNEPWQDPVAQQRLEFLEKMAAAK